MDDIDLKVPVKHTGRKLIEVVRCKNCKYWDEWLPLSPGKGTCTRNPYSGYWSDHREDWYCADGEKDSQ